MDAIVTLIEFIDAAKRSRKYPDNTAMALKTALRLFEVELNDEERASVDRFKENLDRIYQAVFEKNKTKYSSGSLDTYRKRVSKLLNDYERYGTNAAKMNSWSPPVRKPSTTRVAKSHGTKPSVDVDAEETAVAHSDSGARLDWPLANGRKVVLVLPHDLTVGEAEVIKKLVDLRVNKSAG